MAAPGTVNFRVIAMTNYAIVPEGTDLSSSELRRGVRAICDRSLVLNSTKKSRRVASKSNN